MENHSEIDVRKTMEDIDNKLQEMDSSIYQNPSLDIIAIDQHVKKIPIKKLLITDDSIFIINLYHALLKRKPNMQELKYYSDKLDQGVSKRKIIKTIKFSSEGKKNKVKIKGFFIDALLNRSFMPLVRLIKDLTSLLKLKKKQDHLNEKVGDIKAYLEIFMNKVIHVEDAVKNVNQTLQCHKQDIDKLLEETGVGIGQHIFNWDQFYKEFEDHFRGDPKEIKERVRVYLPFLQAVMAKENDFTLLDIGCGRGEWLELLKENHINSIGIDSNKETVESCQQRELVVFCEDVIQYLNRQPSNTFSAITGFHIIEHLPFIILMRLLDEIKRTLKVGGLIIVETPNPMNIVVGCSSFYCDPTHKRPLPPDLTKYLLAQKGFRDLNLIGLNEVTSLNIKEQSELAKQFNNFFYGPRDYGVIGYK